MASCNFKMQFSKQFPLSAFEKICLFYWISPFWGFRCSSEMLLLSLAITTLITCPLAIRVGIMVAKLRCPFTTPTLEIQFLSICCDFYNVERDAIHKILSSKLKDRHIKNVNHVIGSRPPGKFKRLSLTFGVCGCRPTTLIWTLIPLHASFRPQASKVIIRCNSIHRCH